MPATKLSHEQREGLIACGINVEDLNIFPAQWKYCYSHDLMEYVDSRLHELSGRLKCEHRNEQKLPWKYGSTRLCANCN